MKLYKLTNSAPSYHWDKEDIVCVIDEKDKTNGYKLYNFTQNKIHSISHFSFKKNKQLLK